MWKLCWGRCRVRSTSPFWLKSKLKQSQEFRRFDFLAVLNWKLLENLKINSPKRRVWLTMPSVAMCVYVNVFEGAFLWQLLAVFLILLYCRQIYDHDNIWTMPQCLHWFFFLFNLMVSGVFFFIERMCYQMTSISSAKLKYHENKWHHKLCAYYYYYLSNFGRRFMDTLYVACRIFATITKYECSGT